MIIKIVYKFKLLFLYNFKALYTKNIGFSYVFRSINSIIFNLKNIKYLDDDFYYEDRLNPITLFDYVNEVNEYYFLPKDKNLRILEVGANIGIWGYTFKKLMPKSTIYSFEPNPIPFEYLKKNSYSIDNWYIYNYGLLDENCVADFYFSNGKSGQGSIYKKQANLNLLLSAPVLSTKVKMIVLNECNLNKFCNGKKFDFIKIDVEGAELQVLKSIKDADWNHLYVEISYEGSHEDKLNSVYALVNEQWPSSSLLSHKVNTNTIDCIFKC